MSRSSPGFFHTFMLPATYSEWKSRGSFSCCFVKRLPIERNCHQGQVSNLSGALYLAEVFGQLFPLAGLSPVCPFCHLCQDPVWIALRAAVTNDHKLGGSEQQNFVLSHVRRPEVQNQAVPGKTWICFRSSQRESVPCPCPSFWWLPAVLGVPRLAAA